MEHKSRRYTSYKCTGPVYSDFPYLSPVMLVCIMCRYIFLNHIPAITHRAVVTTRSPEMVITPFLQIGKFLLRHSVTSIFDHPVHIANGIFWKTFNRYLHIIRIYTITAFQSTKSSLRKKPLLNIIMRHDAPFFSSFQGNC